MFPNSLSNGKGREAGPRLVQSRPPYDHCFTSRVNTVAKEKGIDRIHRTGHDADLAGIRRKLAFSVGAEGACPYRPLAGGQTDREP